MWTFGHILQALDVVFFIRSMFILGLFNIGGLEPGVSCLLIFGVSRRDVPFCSCSGLAALEPPSLASNHRSAGLERRWVLLKREIESQQTLIRTRVA